MENSDYSIDDIQAFGQIVAAGGISAAARTYDLSKASLSRSLARLETVAGAPLFDRIGRGLRLTPMGETLCATAERAVSVAQEAEDVLRSARGEPSGPLRVAASTMSAQHLLAPVLGRFALAYPDVTVTLVTMSDGPSPLDADLDVVFRLGRPTEERLVARRIISSPLRLYASADLASHHDMNDVAAVQRLGRVIVAVSSIAPNWILHDRAGQQVILDSTPLLSVSDPNVVVGILNSGVGVGCLPAVYAERLVDELRFTRVLPELQGDVVDLFATLPPRRANVPAVRAFLDMVINHADAVHMPDE